MADDEEENPKRFSPQCFLLDFYKSFTAKNEGQSYGNFVKINVEPSQVINKLLNKKDGFGLNELTTAQMSNLVPKFRLYKTYASGEDKEFYFDDHTSIENLGASGTKTTYNKYEDFNINHSTKPLAVGLKSFTWEDLGTNPANQGLSFKASLVLSCPSMQSLFVKSRNGLSFDELICPAGRKKTNETPEYDNKHNRIRADVGWVMPSSSDIWGTQANRDRLKSAIEASQISLYLNLTSHELSINEDGTIELSIEFMASLEAGMFSPKSDLFYLGRDKSKRLDFERTNISNQEKALADLKKKEQDEIDAGGQSWLKDSSKLNEIQALIDRQQEDLDTLKKARADAEESARLKKYQSLLTAIAKQKRFFSIQLTPKEMKAYGELNKLYQRKNLSSGELQTRRRAIIKDLRLFNADYKPNKLANPPSSATSMQAELSDGASRPVEQPKHKTLFIDNRKEQLADAAENIQDTITEAKDPSDRVFNYIYMGDLLEAAFGIVRKNQIDEGDRPDMIWRFMVGQLKIYDFELQKYQNVNVADFPISWEYFQSFFLDKVIKPEKKTYNIRQFVKDIISELLVGSLSPLCFGKMAPEARTKVNTQVLTLPSYGDPDKPFPAGGDSDAENNDDISIFNSVDGKVKWTGYSPQSHNYLFIYPVGGTNYKWKGDYEADQKNSILHLQLGADRGILKSVSFKRQDMPGQREANIQKTVDSGGAVGNLLFSNKYNADLTLYGNTLFTNGTTLYLDPKGLGIGGLNQPNSMAQKLGVGGYYNVVKVNSSIESGKFETSLTTILQGLGNEKNKKADTINSAPPPMEETTRTVDSGERRMNDSRAAAKTKRQSASNTGISKYR
tara:strand:+ start:7323 stop:9860 length:2538 start_codon:yes stop_codon:yes gene_type:complete